jgi:methylated-DNA-protein-cysteine methyltransferase-like protein
MQRKDMYTRFYEVIHRIPYGRVATYGQIAGLAGLPGYARQVGYALHAIPAGLDLPWHRVINAKGMISLKADGPYDQVQRQMLEAEGIQFDDQDRVPLKVYQWVPKSG